MYFKHIFRFLCLLPILIDFIILSKVVGNSLKSLEVSEEKANQRVEEFKRQLKTLTVKHKEAEARAEFAEKTVKKLQKEVDRLEGKSSDQYYYLFRFPLYCHIDLIFEIYLL